jgi:Trk K+ transport system NAD-binding subunit
MVSRGPQVVSPNGSTRLQGGDQVTVLAHVQNEEAVKKALLSPFETGRSA